MGIHHYGLHPIYNYPLGEGAFAPLLKPRPQKTTTKEGRIAT